MWGRVRRDFSADRSGIVGLVGVGVGVRRDCGACGCVVGVRRDCGACCAVGC